MRRGLCVLLLLVACGGEEPVRQVPEAATTTVPDVDPGSPAPVTVADGPRLLTLHRPVEVGQRIRETVDYLARGDGREAARMAESFIFLALGEVQAVDERGQPTRIQYNVMDFHGTNASTRFVLLQPNTRLLVDVSGDEPRYIVGESTPATARIARALDRLITWSRREGTAQVLGPPEPVLPGAEWNVEPAQVLRGAAWPELRWSGARATAEYVTRRECHDEPCEVVRLTVTGAEARPYPDVPTMRDFELIETRQVKREGPGALLRLEVQLKGMARPPGGDEPVEYTIDQTRRIDWLPAAGEVP